MNYDNTTQTITTVYGGGTSIIMNIGSTSYTVNGTPQTMDAALYINSDNCIMVPSRPAKPSAVR